MVHLNLNSGYDDFTVSCKVLQADSLAQSLQAFTSITEYRVKCIGVEYILEQHGHGKIINF
jgi:hypothetical protein